jgi:Arc/MetJ-type ribon-helix-helix transcriptional regulator
MTAETPAKPTFTDGEWQTIHAMRAMPLGPVHDAAADALEHVLAERLAQTVITVDLDPGLVRYVDGLVRIGTFATRGDMIGRAIHDFLARHPQQAAPPPDTENDDEAQKRRRQKNAFLERLAAEAADPEAIARRERDAKEREAFCERLIAEYVSTAKITASAAPVQIEGLTRDGRHFYYRCRHGAASLGFGADQKAAWYDPDCVHDFGPSGFDPEETYASFARLAAKAGLTRRDQSPPSSIVIEPTPELEVFFRQYLELYDKDAPFALELDGHMIGVPSTVARVLRAAAGSLSLGHPVTVTAVAPPEAD